MIPTAWRPVVSLPTFLLASILLFPTSISAQKDNGQNCSCFRTNGSTSGYFTYHRFYDFRNINLSLISTPAVLTDPNNTSNAGVTSSFFTDQAWTKDWTIQSWNNSAVMSDDNATVLMINSPNNVYIEKSTHSSRDCSSYLTLRTTRTSIFQSSAEIDSTEQNFHYLSARFLARVIGSPGACAGMFTYLASSPVQEADIEILTQGPRNVVQYTNQPSNSNSGDILANATVNGSIPSGLDWSTWNTYRLDWMPNQSYWYVNGLSAANISFQVPIDPAGLILNMWSDGGPWTGNMAIHDAAYLQIQYIEIVYNTSGPYSGSSSQTTTKSRLAEKMSDNFLGDDFGAVGQVERRDSASAGCKVVCSVDEVPSVGTPVILYNNTGAATSYMRPGNWGKWAPGMLLMGVGLDL